MTITGPPLLLALYSLLLLLCSGPLPAVGESGGGVAPPDGMMLEVTIGPELKDCTGAAPQKCLVVDGEYFYSAIDGFDYEPGYTYRIRMERYDRWPDQEPPQDAGRYGYRLIEVLKKTREP